MSDSNGLTIASRVAQLNLGNPQHGHERKNCNVGEQLVLPNIFYYFTINIKKRCYSVESRCYFSLSAFIKLFNILEKLQGEMAREKMNWDFSCSAWTLEWWQRIFQTEMRKKRTPLKTNKISIY